MGELNQEIVVGTTFTSQRRTISDTDFSLLNMLVWATAPAHTDDEFAKSSPFGRRILDGPSALAVGVGLAVHAEVKNIHTPLDTRIVALVGIDNARFRAPIFAADTVLVRSEVFGFDRTKSGARMLLRLREALTKADDSVAIDWERTMLIVGGLAPGVTGAVSEVR